jgi:hypothetical protein
MSTKKTEITSTTTRNKVNDNKAVFGPLGKYAVVAVIMVGLIVTTAIVLDKELGTAEEKLAAVENEVAATNAVDSETTEKVEHSEAAASITVAAETSEAQDTTELAEIETGAAHVQASSGETGEVQVHETKAPIAVETNETIATVKETVADSSSYTEQASNAVPAISTQTTAKIESARTDTKAKNSFQERQSQSVADNQYKQWPSRIEAYKLEQKQHMTERLTRIKSLESEQLDQYKVRQEKQIERLREQITQQQQMIETLILRNQERFDMRAASMQRHQARREQILNRI